VALQLAMSFLSQINEYTILQDLREKFSELLSEPRFSRFKDSQDFQFHIQNGGNTMRIQFGYGNI